MIHILATDKNGKVLDVNAQKVSLQTAKGIITILPHHKNLITQISAWNIKYVPVDVNNDWLWAFEDQFKSIYISWWLALITSNTIKIISD